MSGPPPKHPSRRARRNNAKAEFRTLSTEVTVLTPRWPLPADASMTAKVEVLQDQVAQLQAALLDETDGRKLARLRKQLPVVEIAAATAELQLQQAADGEREMWSELWAMPQATVWQETHSERAVAQYVRLKIRAEQGDLKASVEARQWADRLGLNPLALFRLRVEIEHAELAADAAEKRQGARKPVQEPEDGDDPRAGLYGIG